jgi:heptosyltransferase-3
MKREYCGPPREALPLQLMDVFVDRYAKWFYKKRPRGTVSKNPKILIASLGHMGDALTVSYLFPFIYKKYPKAIIDIITPTWCRAVSESNPYVRSVFCIDHYLGNRKKIGLWQKLTQNYRSIQEALPGLKKEEYDYYLDVRTSYGVSHFILPFIHVKKAIGFNRRGMGGLLDVELTVPKHGHFHHFDTYAALLKEIGIEAKLEDVVPYFTINSSVSLEKIEKKLPSLRSKPYLLLFPESGEDFKQMSNAFWIKTVREILLNSSYSIVFCGQTELSSKIIKGIPEGKTEEYSDRLINASNQLSIHELAFLSEKAAYALTLDSFPEHLCCIFCKTITIYKATGFPFFPIAAHPVLLIHGHKPSADTEYVRKNVEIIYCENPEAEETAQLVCDRIIPY